MKKLALVLGGGASKGYAHIGVLQTLEQNGIKPDLIVGTSMGAIVGGFYACGMDSQKLTEISISLSRRAILDFSLIRTLFKYSILRGKKIRKILTKYIGNTTHSQTKIPFVAIATDIIEGKQVVLEQGEVVDSMIASSALPSIFPAVKFEDKLLNDGGLVNNVPDDVAREMAEDYVILSVDVVGEYSKQRETSKMKVLSGMVNALTLMQTQITKYKRICSDLKLDITQADVPQMSFNKQTTLKSIQYGAEAMEGNIAKLKKLLED